jgi:hypothetical protein
MVDGMDNASTVRVIVPYKRGQMHEIDWVERFPLRHIRHVNNEEFVMRVDGDIWIPEAVAGHQRRTDGHDYYDVVFVNGRNMGRRTVTRAAELVQPELVQRWLDGAWFDAISRLPAPTRQAPSARAASSPTPTPPTTKAGRSRASSAARRHERSAGPQCPTPTSPERSDSGVTSAPVSAKRPVGRPRKTALPAPAPPVSQIPRDATHRLSAARPIAPTAAEPAAVEKTTTPALAQKAKPPRTPEGPLRRGHRGRGRGRGIPRS